ncbi:MAG: hypothetical protein M0Z76_02440 [Gammaproteobacteria bacterium]|nr:hypothetical protein [Gammaproteobacteria bacterium]
MLRSGRSLVAVPILVALSACSSQTASADSPPAVAVRVGHARRTLMPRMAVAIGEILPGAEPFLRAPVGGTLTAFSVGRGQSMTRGTAIATIQPAHGAPIVLRAPAPAIVTRTLIPAGTHVTAGQRVVGLRGPDIREARLPFAASVAAHFVIGQPVTLHSPLNPRGRLRGHIVAIKPGTQDGARYIYADLPPLPGFTPGSPVRADILLAQKPAITVPAASVTLRTIGTVVFVIRNGRAHEEPVKVEIRRRHRVAVSGVAAGARVAASALGQLRSGTRVRVRSDG